jgi:hypothetical protein
MPNFQLRCKDEELRAWHGKAARAGTTLSQLVRKLLEEFEVPVAIPASDKVLTPTGQVQVPAGETERVVDTKDPFAGWCARCRWFKVAICPACRRLASGA